MKNLLKLFAVVLVSVFILVSCDKKGGTIEVTNGFSTLAYVIIVEGIDFAEALQTVKDGGGTTIQVGGKKSFSFDKDGIYTVVAVSSVPSELFYTHTITLALGSVEKVTAKVE